MSKPRDRTADLDRLADAVIGHMEDVGTLFGLDPLKPFGFRDVGGSVLEIIGAAPEEREGGYPTYSQDQRDYAADLWGDVLGYIKDRWRATRRAGK